MQGKTDWEVEKKISKQAHFYLYDKREVVQILFTEL